MLIPIVRLFLVAQRYLVQRIAMTGFGESSNSKFDRNRTRMTLIGQIKADKSKNLRRKIRKNPLHPRYPRSIFGTAVARGDELTFLC